MKDFSQLRTISESTSLTEEVGLVSETITDIQDAISAISRRIADEGIVERLAEISEELDLYNKYFTIAEDCILNEYDSGMLPAIAESFRTGDTFEYTYDNGETVEITPEIAEIVTDIYDNLDEENRSVFAAIIDESADDLEEVLNYFAEVFTEDEELDESHYAGQRPDERRPSKVDDTPDENLGPKQGLKIAKDRKAYLARKAAEADAKRKAAGGLKKEDLEGDTNTISEKGFDKQDRPTKKAGPSHRDLAATAKWMRKNKVDPKATTKNKGSK